jgi:AcrR family transcriptional regulator
VRPITEIPPPQRADARRNRESILEASRELFAEYGFDAQIDHIAHRAGVGVGTVYRHFPTKDDLLKALIAERFAGLAEAAREANADPDPWSGFAAFMRYSAGVMAGDRALSEAMGERPEEMRAAAEGAGMPDLLEELVTRTQAAGVLRRDLVWSDVPGLICGMGRVLSDGKVGPLEMSWERYLAIILDGLRVCDATHLPD